MLWVHRLRRPDPASGHVLPNSHIEKWSGRVSEDKHSSSLVERLFEGRQGQRGQQKQLKLVNE